MASKLKKDRLSRYFKDLDFDLSSGDEESGEEGGNNASATVVKDDPGKMPDTSVTKSDSNKAERDEKLKDSSKTVVTLKKLPSARDCLGTESSPTFLRLGKLKEVDWDQRVRGLHEPDQPVDYERNAVPPPSSYEPMTDPGIKVVDEEGNKRKRIGDDLPDQNTATKAYKVHKDDCEET